MNDKEIMEGLLTSAKGMCDLLMHGSIESSTPNVHQAFQSALNDALCMQRDISQPMSGHGWYTAQPEQPQRIQQVKQKFVG